MESHASTAARCRTPTRCAACRRCTAPAATRSAWAREVLGREANSVDRQPHRAAHRRGADLVSGGNFHGQPVALALDLAAIAAAELANISERRVEQLVNPAPLQRAAAVPRAEQRAALGLHDRAGGERLAGQREQGALPPRVGGLDPLERGARGSREHGEHQREEARAGDRQRARLAGDRAAHGGGGRGSAKAAPAEQRGGGGGGDRARGGAGADRGSSAPPRHRGRAELISSGELARAVASAVGPLA
jgi:hypothetical protein